MRYKKLLILGIGVIAGHVLDLLSRVPENYQIVVVSRDEAKLRERVNLAVAVAMNGGRVPDVSFRIADIANIDQTADLIATLQPEIIVNATSLQTFWLISTLPRERYQYLSRAALGPWLPNHLALTRKLMIALRQSSVSAQVVNAAFPDAVNPALGKVGLAPLVGAGNVANTIPTLRRAAALMCGVPVESIDIRFYAHHYVGNRIASTGDPGPAPYALRILRDGVDVTGKIDVESLFDLFTTKLKRTRGVPGQIMAASSVAAIVRAIANDTGQELHAPGPNGLPGGYPVRVRAHGVSVIDDLVPIKSAIAVNEGGGIFEGIERIDDDGTVHFAEANMSIMKNAFGYYCKTMKLDEVDDWAQELRARYRTYADGLATATPSTAVAEAMAVS